MSRWLFKTDPDTYGWKDLAGKSREVWDGVANPLALKHLRAVKKGDEILIYHTGEEKAVVGIARAVCDGYPDPKDKSGKLAVVDLSPLSRLGRPVTLAEIKSSAKFKDWELVRMSRLSVMPAGAGQWNEILRLAKS